MPSRPLTVAVTGPTGTFGYGLMPLLQADPKVERIVGVARRPFDPAAEGWTKLEYRQGDVRDPEALGEAFAHQRDMPLMQGAHGRDDGAGKPFRAPGRRLLAQV